MVQEISLKWMKKQIDESNRGASRNRNLYPIQEQATQMEIWESVNCTCTATCRCRKSGCTSHWKLRSGVTADQFRFAFLRTFVDRCEHLNLLKALERDEKEYPISRYKEAYAVLKSIDDDWDDLSRTAAAYNRTLFCDDWDKDAFRDEWQGIKVKTGIYHAKKFCLLLPDTCVPYDTRALGRILKCLGLSPQSDYYSLLVAMRERFLPLLEDDKVTLSSLRRLDDPGKCLKFNSLFVSFPRLCFDYGPGYLPAERQVSFVLDKCFYNPKESAEVKREEVF
jgi:hypothetical protein